MLFYPVALRIAPMLSHWWSGSSRRQGRRSTGNQSCWSIGLKAHPHKPSGNSESARNDSLDSGRPVCRPPALLRMAVWAAPALAALFGLMWLLPLPAFADSEDFAKLQKSNELIGRIFTISVKRTTKDKKALFSSISCEHRRKKGQTYPVLFESCFPVWCLICSIAGRLRLPGRLCRTTGYAP